MKTLKTLITDNIGTITINGYCSDNAKILVILNNQLVYYGSVIEKEIISGTLSYSGQKELISFDIPLHSNIHYDEYKILCIKGNITIGAVHEHFYKDIANIDSNFTYKIYQKRLLGLPVPKGSYAFYRKNENDMLLNKLFVEINNEKIVHDPNEGHIAGWLYPLRVNDVLSFYMDNFNPVDALTFIVDAQPDEEYFEKDYK